MQYIIIITKIQGQIIQLNMSLLLISGKYTLLLVK
jgi:hypothetical protein